MTDLFVEDGTTISGFAFLCTRSALWDAIQDVYWLGYNTDWDKQAAAYERVRAMLGMDDAEASELGPDSTG